MTLDPDIIQSKIDSDSDLWYDAIWEEIPLFRDAFSRRRAVHRGNILPMSNQSIRNRADGRCGENGGHSCLTPGKTETGFSAAKLCPFLDFWPVLPAEIPDQVPSDERIRTLPIYRNGLCPVRRASADHSGFREKEG